MQFRFSQAAVSRTCNITIKVIRQLHRELQTNGGVPDDGEYSAAAMQYN
jgi:hypothetical protein